MLRQWIAILLLITGSCCADPTDLVRDWESWSGFKESDQPLSRDQLWADLFKHSEKDINVEDFLWTGSGEGEFTDDYFYDDLHSPNNAVEGPVRVVPTTMTVTQLSTVVTTVVSTPTVTIQSGSYGGVDEGRPPYLTSPELVSPTPVLPTLSTASPHTAPHPAVKVPLPEDRFLVRTVVHSNMTVLHNGIEGFKAEMEEKLTRAYRHAYEKNRAKREVEEKNRDKRQVEDEATTTFDPTTFQPTTFDPTTLDPSTTDEESPEESTVTPADQVPSAVPRSPRVQIHNIRSSLPRPQIEMLYTVYEDGSPVPATEAVAILTSVGDDDVEKVIGFPLMIKAEPYISRDDPAKYVKPAATNTNWLIAAVIISALLIIAICIILSLLIHRSKGKLQKHQRLVSSSSPAPSSHDPSHNGIKAAVKTSPSLGSLNASAFTLQQSVRHSKFDEKASPSVHSTARLTGSKESNVLVESPPSDRAAGGDSPTLADLSSNNATPETRTKAKRKQRKHFRSSSREQQLSQSAFPVSTPDKAGWLGPLTDLLEEDATLPGESREASASRLGHWPYLPPKSPSTTSTASSSSSALIVKEEGTQVTPSWRQEALATREAAKRYSKALNDTFASSEEGEPPKEEKVRAISAKSHIFRRNKVEARLTSRAPKGPERPSSAHETTFHMRQRHWEGLITGRKHLHHGKLLPGSTSEEEPAPAATCWSECTSPRGQVRLRPTTADSQISSSTVASSSRPDPVGPLIQSIRVELKKFGRPKSPNLTGISVINDPELVQKEED